MQNESHLGIEKLQRLLTYRPVTLAIATYFSSVTGCIDKRPSVIWVLEFLNDQLLDILLGITVGITHFAHKHFLHICFWAKCDLLRRQALQRTHSLQLVKGFF